MRRIFAATTTFGGGGATTRGAGYLETYPGTGGWLLFLASTGAVFLAGAKILDCLNYERAEKDAAKS